MVKTFDLTDPNHRGEPPRHQGRKGPKGGPRRRGKPKNALDGWIVLDKPIGLTSTQALGAVKRVFTPEKAGHAGTLDPLASGLLPLAFGDATKTVPYVVDGAKTYRFTVTWGTTTDTDDADGSAIEISPVRPDRAAIEAALPAFIGDIEQVPPRYSAIKVNGQRAYDLARGGEAVELKARIVTITRLEIVGEPTEDTVVLEADCGKGTYVRAIARDLAAQLGTAGHVSALRRTRVGPFFEADMVPLQTLNETVDPTSSDACQALVDQYLRPPSDGLCNVTSLAVDRPMAGRLRRGQSALVRPLGAVEEDTEIAAFDGSDLVALCRAQQGALHPTRVFRSPRRRITVMPARPAEGEGPPRKTADGDTSAPAGTTAHACTAAPADNSAPAGNSAPADNDAPAGDRTAPHA